MACLAANDGMSSHSGLFMPVILPSCAPQTAAFQKPTVRPGSLGTSKNQTISQVNFNSLRTKNRLEYGVLAPAALIKNQNHYEISTKF